MRLRMLLAGVALALTTLPALAVDNEPWSIFGITGNDLGGIIPWSPQLRAYGYVEAAQRHCDGYKRIAHVTSVHARYGDYVGFECFIPRNYDPVKTGQWWWQPY